MVETPKILPSFCGVAGFTVGGGAVDSNLGHSFLELPFVGIGMTQRAGTLAPVIPHNRCGLRLVVRRRLMAIVARNGDVASRQQEARFPVAHQRERRRPPTQKRVTRFAAAQMRSRGELSLMLVGVAIQAAPELDLVHRVFAFGDVALRTLNGCVLAL